MLYTEQENIYPNEDQKDCTLKISQYCDGLYQYRTLGDFGYFVFNAKPSTDYMLFLTKAVPKEEFVLKKKIPEVLFQKIKEFFEVVYKNIDSNGNQFKTEVMAQIWYDKKNNKFFIYIPEQEVSYASVKAIPNKEMMADMNLLWLCDFHSHSDFNAFFSGGDNADEITGRIYGVIGNINTDNKSYVLRAGCNGKFFNLKHEDVFDSSLNDLAIKFVAKDHIHKIAKISVSNYIFPHQKNIYKTNNTFANINNQYSYLNNNFYNYEYDEYDFSKYKFRNESQNEYDFRSRFRNTKTSGYKKETKTNIMSFLDDTLGEDNVTELFEIYNKIYYNPSIKVTSEQFRAWETFNEKFNEAIIQFLKYYIENIFNVDGIMKEKEFINFTLEKNFDDILFAIENFVNEIE